jgi:hypothetical protein
MNEVREKYNARCVIVDENWQPNGGGAVQLKSFTVVIDAEPL